MTVSSSIPTPVTTRPIVTLGEGLGVLRGTTIGSLEQLPELAVGTGGAEANVAIGLARLGASVTWLGRVGDDGLGRRVVRELRAEGVDVAAIVDDGAPTGLLIKSTPAPGHTAVAYYRAGSAGSRLEPSDLDRLDIAGASLLHLTGITPALSASAAAAVERAIDLAEAAGVPVSLDVNYRSLLWSAEAASAALRPIATRCTVVFAGVEEAQLLVGRSASSAAEPADPDDLPAVARAVAALGVDEVVLKLGADGAIALIDGELHERAAIRVTVVDTVGAGDAFVAGYLAEYVAGLTPAERLETAVRAGAAACRHPGDWEGSPRRAELAHLDAGDPVRR